MNILFLTLFDFQSFSERNIYCDMLREFRKNGHEVYCISPTERRYGIPTHWEENEHLLKLRIGNTQKTNLIEKGISTLLIEPQFVLALKKYFSNVHFDLILYSTPPITLGKAIQYVKKRDGARTYLILKDIFPQNAVDLEMLSERGLKGFLLKYFRAKEKKLYAISDTVGCMSSANVKYLLAHNPEVNPEKVEICPNAMEPLDFSVTEEQKREIRTKYGIPLDKKVFVYGGNLGKPQGIPFLTECLRAEAENPDAFFLLVGDGTEYPALEEFIDSEKPANVKLIRRLPRDDYDRMITSCDVGLIFLDFRFTIPNFPSRLLAYQQAGIPVLSCTDPNTDLGTTVTEGNFGWACRSNSVSSFSKAVEEALRSDLKRLGENGYRYFVENYSVARVYKIITESLKS